MIYACFRSNEDIYDHGRVSCFIIAANVVVCLTRYPRIKNAEESIEGWMYGHPIPPGAKVIFTCTHPQGFTDGSKEHVATCSSVSPDVWHTTFDEDDKNLCPPPSEHAFDCPTSENQSIVLYMAPICLDFKGYIKDVLNTSRVRLSSYFNLI